jgi:hypothetical protein
MHPKKSIQQLNFRREINRRLRFIKRRIPETVVEHHFFQGKLSALPVGMKSPPSWAREAANLFWIKGLGAHFAHITRDEIERDPRGAVREITAIHECLMSYISSPKLDTELSEIGDKELIEIKRALWPDVGALLLQNLKKIDARLDELLEPATHEQLIAYRERELRATRALAPKDDAWGIGNETMTVKIAYAIWFFWPEWDTKSRVTAGDLYSWLEKNLGLHVSLKLVELVFTKIRMRPRVEKGST